MKSQKPIFYLKGNIIWKRPREMTIKGGKKITIGFPVCTVSSYVDAKSILDIFNETEKP